MDGGKNMDLEDFMDREGAMTMGWRRFNFLGPGSKRPSVFTSRPSKPPGPRPLLLSILISRSLFP